MTFRKKNYCFGSYVRSTTPVEKVLLFGVTGFTMTSLLIGLSQTSTILVSLRAVQGLAAAFMAPTALSILLTTFKEGDERNNALSIWSLVASGGAAVGVFLGGILTQYLGWEWCFFVNVPVGILTLIGIIKQIPQDKPMKHKVKMDVLGAILVTSGLMAFVYTLTLAAQTSWKNIELLLWFGASILLLTGFIINELKVKHPLMPLHIFKIRNVAGGNLMMLPIVAGALGQFFFLTLYFQNTLHYSPVQTGLSFLPIPILIGIISRRAPQLIKKFGVKPLLVTGTSLTTVGVFMFSTLNAESVYWTTILPYFIIMASGFGIAVVGITIAATNGVPSDESGLASGLINTSQQIGGALGLAVLAVVASVATEQARAMGLSQGLSNLYGYQHVFMTASGLMLVSVFIAWFVIRMPKEKIANEQD